MAMVAPQSLFFHDYDDLHLNDVRPILRGQYDVLILGGLDEPTYLLLWAWGVAFRKKILIWCETTAYDKVRGRIREAFKRLLLRDAAGCIASGQRAFEYCRQLGVPESRIFIAPNATRRDYFQGKAESLLPVRDILRREAHLNGFVILFVGRLKEVHKGISTLIKTCVALEKKGISVSLLLAGEGPDDKYYRKIVQKEGLRDVRFMGTLEHETLCRYYAMADVLVLPSRSEPWGFVLNEGMEFGLPLVVSDVVGAGPDLVRHGENGFVVPVGDKSALAKVLENLARDETLRHRMGQASRSIIQAFTPERWAQGVVQAIEACEKPQTFPVPSRLPGMPSPKDHIKSIFLHGVSYVSWVLGVTELLRRLLESKPGAIVLYYHRVIPQQKSETRGYWGNITSLSRFTKHLSYLGQKYHFITPDDLFDFAVNSKFLSRTPVLLTFDDGYRSIYQYGAPILNESKIPALILITTEIFNREFLLPADEYAEYRAFPGEDNQKANTRLYLSLDEVKKLISMGFELGSHTLTHPELGRLSIQEQKRQITLSKQKIEEMFDVPVRYFSYPIGEISQETPELVKQAGYQAGFLHKSGYVMAATDPFCLPRIAACNYPVPVLAFKIVAIRLWYYLFHKSGIFNKKKPEK